MITSREEWKSSFKELQALLKKPDEAVLPGIKQLILELNGFTHESVDAEDIGSETLEDLFWKSLDDYTNFSEKKLYSPAWHMWHSARVEDITCSHFILQKEEVFDTSDFISRIGVPFRHTGNSMAFADMETFNLTVNLDELRTYRKEVAAATSLAMKELTVELLKSRVSPESISRIAEIGSVEQSDSWLLDYWGKKKVSGIITMPLTRHLLVHINSAMR